MKQYFKSAKNKNKMQHVFQWAKVMFSAKANTNYQWVFREIHVFIDFALCFGFKILLDQNEL